MILRQLRRSVAKHIKSRLHAPMYDGKPCAPGQVAMSNAANNNIVKSCKPKSPKVRLFEELVFYPKGRGTVTSNGESNSDVNAAYEEAIQQLNTLQSNEQTIRRSMANPRIDTIADTIKYLERSGLPLTTLEQLSFIHVAGTKGKGSTCALTESILRQHGMHTGFYSSPHILSTNERIRIDGESLAQPKFTYYFWQVYNRLWAQREHETDMPAYFKFLTILSFHVFVAECVDVVVLEVGIGGEQDCTNIVRNVRTVGITSLGLEHTELLGNTLRQIAWQKAGIIKPQAHVYTHVTQPECLQVLGERAAQQQASLYEVPPFEAYFQHNQYAQLLSGFNEVVRLNGSLAMQLASDWLSRRPEASKHGHKANEVQLSEELLLSLRNCHWPGRCQLVEFLGMRLHLDGAHTVESMHVCSDWFRQSTKYSNNPKILIFNRTGHSDVKALLLLLSQMCVFDMVCFVPNVASSKGINPSQVTVRSSAEAQLKRAQAIAASWQQLCASLGQPNSGRVYDNVCEAFADVRARYAADRHTLDVLITGSIHLLGAAVAAMNEFQTAKQQQQ